SSGADVPNTIGTPMRACHGSCEADVRIQIETFYVGFEVAMDLRMPGIGGDIPRHRKIPVLHHAGVGVDVQRVVSRAGAEGPVVDTPQPADVGRLLVANGGNAAVPERLDHRQPARSCANNAYPWVRFRHDIKFISPARCARSFASYRVVLLPTPNVIYFLIIPLYTPLVVRPHRD